MAFSIKQGDACAVPVRITLGGEAVTAESVELVEFMLGDVRKLYPGDAEYDADMQQFRVPLTQEDTFSLPEDDAVRLDVRVRFRGGTVLGTKKYVPVVTLDAVSREII